MEKLYIVVRGDLPFGAQAVQAAHALQEFNVHFPKETSRWYRSSNTLVLLTTPNEKTLEELCIKAVQRGFPSTPFHEPDMSGAMTALALGMEGRRLVAKLPMLAAAP